MQDNLFSIAGVTVLITGGARGLGLVYATAMGQAGARVALCDMNQALVRETEAVLNSKGIGCCAYEMDVTDEMSVKSCIEQVESEFGTVDVLINNAGINLRGPLEELEESVWQKVIDVNLTGTWRVSKYVARGMIARQAGKIINIASLLSFAGRPNIAPYAASKGGITMLTKSMAVEWAQHNIQVNAIAPGYFATEMTRELVEDEAFSNWVKLRTPAKRWGDPEELVGLAIFLASKASSFISGQVIYVDGGWTSNL